MSSPSWRDEVLRLSRTVHLHVDSERRILDALGDTLSLLGEPPEALVGRPLDALPAGRPHLALSLLEQLSARAPGPRQTRALETEACGAYLLADGNMAVRLTADSPDDGKVIQRLADRLPVMIAYVDTAGCFRLNNQAYLDFIGLDRETLYGRPVSSVLDEASHAKVARRFRRALAGEEVNYEDRLTLADGRTVFVKVHYVPDFLDGEVVGLYAIVQDISEYASMIQLLRDVHTGINRTDIGTREIIEQLLKDALDYLSLEIGLISRIEGERYTVWWIASRGPEIAPGTTFALGDTYCRLMLDEADVFHTVRAGDDPRIGGHPCYQAFGLESYIGIPLRVNGRVWGTLNFSSAAPRGRPFSEIEEELLRLIANAAERVITHEVEFERVRRERDQMANQALTDHLTGLPNRSALEHRIDELMEGRDAGDPPFSLAVLDIDHFKAINDTHGHDVGDRVLCWLGARMAECLRDGDLIARTGGEEFVIVMPAAGQDAAREIVERVRTHVGRGRVPLDDGQTLGVTISGGIGEHQPGESYPDLFRLADAALYAAKRAGRDRTHLAVRPA